MLLEQRKYEYSANPAHGICVLTGVRPPQASSDRVSPSIEAWNLPEHGGRPGILGLDQTPWFVLRASRGRAVIPTSTRALTSMVP